MADDSQNSERLSYSGNEFKAVGIYLCSEHWRRLIASLLHADGDMGEDLRKWGNFLADEFLCNAHSLEDVINAPSFLAGAGVVLPKSVIYPAVHENIIRKEDLYDD